MRSKLLAMRAIVTAVVAAIEAAAVAFAGLAVVAVPALLLWMVVFGLAAEPGAVVAGISGVWLLAYWVPMRLEIDAQAALSLGLSPEPLGFALSLAPLGLTLVTVLLAARAGWRFGARGGTGAAGALGGLLGFGAVAFGAATFAAPLAVWPLWLAVLVPALSYGAVSAAAFVVRAARDDHGWWRACTRAVQRAVERLGASHAAAVLPVRAAEAVRLATAVLVSVLGLASFVFAVAVVVGYPHVIALTQGLHLDPLGSVLVFLVQLALLPVAIVWSTAWLTGAGFAVGAGSLATPFEALLGPLPALPIFGVIPQGWGALGALAPAAIVLVGVVVGVLFARSARQRRSTWLAALVTPVVAAALAGLAVAALCALAAGSLGPGRLDTVGAEPWLTGGLAAAELGGGLLVGVVAARIDLARVRIALPDAVRAVNGRVRGARPATGESRSGALPFLSESDDEILGSIPQDAADPVDGETVDLSEARAAEARGKADAEHPRGAGAALRRWMSRDAGTVEPAVDAAADLDGAQDADAQDTAALDAAAPDGSADTSIAPADAPAEGGRSDAPAPDDTAHDTEALLRAYSWDERESQDGEPDPPRRPWGRRKR